MPAEQTVRWRPTFGRWGGFVGFGFVLEVIEKILTHLGAEAAEPEAPRRPPCGATPRRGLFDWAGSADEHDPGPGAGGAAAVAAGLVGGARRKTCPRTRRRSGTLRLGAGPGGVRRSERRSTAGADGREQATRSAEKAFHTACTPTEWQEAPTST